MKFQGHSKVVTPNNLNSPETGTQVQQMALATCITLGKRQTFLVLDIGDMRVGLMLKFVKQLV